MKFCLFAMCMVYLSSGFADGDGGEGGRFFEPSLVVTADYFSGLNGGVHPSGHEGLLLVDIGGNIDLEEGIGLSNISFDFNFLYLVGTSPSASFVGDWNGISNIDSDTENLRLFEAAFRGELIDGSLEFGIGQLAADSVFFGSEVSALFINSTFGWAAAGIQSNAPAYGQASLGTMFDYALNDAFNILSGVYSTDIGDVTTDSSARHGFYFKLPKRDSFVWFNESQWNARLGSISSQLNLGFWVEEGEFREGSTSVSHNWNYGYYLVLDRIRLSEDGLTGFVRFAASPSDRNEFVSYFDLGISGRSFIPSRPDDHWGIAYSNSVLSDHLFQGENPETEGVVELTWQAHVGDGLIFQPTFQYISNPSGHEGSSVSDSLVAGIRIQGEW